MALSQLRIRAVHLTTLLLFLRHVACFTPQDLQAALPGIDLFNLTSLDFCPGNGIPLSGPIPPEIGLLNNLTSLRICTQNLSGPVPAQIGSLINLQVLQLSANNLSGPIPPEIGNLKSLYQLDLSENNFSTPIPPELGLLTSLVKLDLHSSHFVGPIPPQIGNLSSLTDLELHDNSLTGFIPEDLLELTNLTVLALQSNQLSGLIPASLGNLTQLSILAFQYNNLSGSIPPQIGNLRNLTGLYLWNNSLEGQIPSELGNLSDLSHLFLQNNSLSGQIPTTLAELTGLEQLVLENNLLNGVIPPQLGALARLSVLSLAGNGLTGSIPRELQQMTSLTQLYLLRNNLTGSIPPELGNLTQLQTLNLGQNQLSGAIPAALAEPPSLANLVLQDNNLSGHVPPRFFPRFDAAQILDGNPGLNLDPFSVTMGPPQDPTSVPSFPPPVPQSASPVSAAPPQKMKHEFPYSFPFLAATVGGNLAFLLLVFLALAACFCRGGSAKPPYPEQTPAVEMGGPNAPSARACAPSVCTTLLVSDSDSNSSSAFVTCPPNESARSRRLDAPPTRVFAWAHRFFTLRELREATLDFSEVNIIGRGSSGTVYFATLFDGSTVAVKRLDVSKPLDDATWHAEVDAIGEARHRNLCSLLGVCDEKGERLLVLEFFSGGSLKQRLEGGGSEEDFSWEERMNVIEGVCRGLSYLHHDISPPLLHSRVKASKVLLSRGRGRALEASLTDYGLTCLAALDGASPYAAPESFKESASGFSAKRDVYAFGVLVLETLTGRPVSEIKESARAAEALVDFASRAVLRDGRGLDLVDAGVRARDGFDALEAERCISIAMECLQQDPALRPTMESVNLRLRLMRSRRAMRVKAGISSAFSP